MDAIVLDLVKKAKSGDTGAFSQLYDQFAKKLFRYIKIKIQNQQQAEDLLQDAFIKIWKNLHLFADKESGNFQAWVYKITANCINDHFRKAYRQPENLELNENINIATSENLEKAVGDRLETEQAKQAFKLLSVQHRTVLELRFVQDLSLADTSKILNKSNLAIRVLQHRALKKLREAIKHLEISG